MVLIDIHAVMVLIVIHAVMVWWCFMVLIGIQCQLDVVVFYGVDWYTMSS